MRVIHSLKMDLVRPWTGDLLHMVQGDSNTRVVELQLFSDGKEWDIPSADLVTVAFKKPDQTKGFYETNGTIDGNRIQVVLAPQVLTAHGKVTVVVELRNAEGSSLASFPFGIMVSQNPEVDAEASEDYFNYVNPFITDALEEVEAAAQAAREAADNANAASGVADEAKQKAEEANAKVDTLREVVSKFHSNIQETVRGEVITVSDASDLPLAGLKVFGKTEQNGIPTPDNPVALDSVGDVNVTVCGKNLLDTNTVGALPNVIVERPSANTLKVYNTKASIYNAANTPLMLFRAGKTYTLSYTVDAFELGDVHVAIRDAGNIIRYQSIITKTGFHSVTFTPTEDIEYYLSILVSMNVEKFGSVTLSNIQLEESSTATAYEPYKEPNTVTVLTPDGLPGIPVESGGNYTDPVTGKQWICDEVDFEKGEYLQRVKEINFSNITWTYSPEYNMWVSPNDYKDGVNSALLCETLPHNLINVGDTTLGTRLNAPYNIWARNGSSINPPAGKALYILAQEKPIPLSEIDPDALTEYAKLHTNYPNTTVFNDVGAGMEVKYVADTKLYVDKKFNELAAALVSKV